MRRYHIGEQDARPWGGWKVLDVHPDYVVKHIHVLPGKRLSLQRHRYREEVWAITRGIAEVTLEDKVFTLKVGESTKIPLRAWHRIHNIGEEMLEFVETQTGSQFDEDDIERKEDDFGRI